MTYRLPDARQDEDDEQAVAYLQTYCGTGSDGCYTGAFFDGWGGNREPDRFTADDVVAVGFLSVFVPPLAARELLDRQAERFTTLLAAVGPDRDLVDETASIEPDWPAWQLYTALRGLPGIGRTIATKLMARKRPRLIPIYDSVVGEVTQSRSRQWEPVRAALQADGGALHRRLLDLRVRSGLDEELSALRVYDVISWMEGKARGMQSAEPEERLGSALADRTGDDRGDRTGDDRG